MSTKGFDTSFAFIFDKDEERIIGDALFDSDANSGVVTDYDRGMQQWFDSKADMLHYLTSHYGAKDSMDEKIQACLMVYENKKATSIECFVRFA